jgi:nucleoid-associated protein YgaU
MATPLTITIMSGNLFQIAAQYYSDATLWWLIASANDLTDPQILGSGTPITLIIPAYNASYVGGIPQ